MSTRNSLRQRQIRREIVQNEARETQQKRRIAAYQTGASSMMGTFYAVVLVSLLLLVIGVLSVVRPKLLPWNRPSVPQQVLVLLYPNDISPNRDLVPVVRNYAICTPDNFETRKAIRYLIQQREALKSRSIRVVLYPRENEQIQYFGRTTAFCGGDDFREKFLERPLYVQNDMFLWCMLHESRVQGIMEYGMEFHRSLREYQNMAIQVVGSEQRISPSLLVSTSGSTVPSNMLEWLLTNTSGEGEESDYRQRMETHLFHLVQNDAVTWTLLDAICGVGGDNDEFSTRK
jgi:hypothetical protein